MRRREQLYAKIVVTMMLTAVLVSALLLYLGSAADAGSADLRNRLQCDSDRIVTTMVSYDNTKETREPDELAAQWADHVAAQRPSLVRSHYISHAVGNRRQLAFSDRRGHIIAVLSYEKDAGLGWRLESIIECA